MGGDSGGGCTAVVMILPRHSCEPDPFRGSQFVLEPEEAARDFLIAGASVKLTGRDIEILRWIGKHGAVTSQQVARRFFVHDGVVTQKRAYRRLEILEDINLIRRDGQGARRPDVLRLRKWGATVAGGNAQAVPHYTAEQLPHALAVVDIVEELLASHPGSWLRTGRELRRERSRELAEGTRQAGIGRIPDAVLTLPSGDSIAIEVGLTPRSQREYRAVLLAYKQERFSRIWWYVPEVAVSRVHDLIVGERCDDIIEVRAGPGPAAEHPEITPLEVDILTWIGRFGVVNERQIGRHFFTREDGHIGLHALSNRVRRLEAERLVCRRIPAARQSPVYSLTRAGADLCDASLRPAHWLPLELKHSLAVVDLMETLVSEQPGSRVKTEREIRAERGRAAGGQPRRDRRVPDAELILPTGRVVAIELDRTPKRSPVIEGIVRLYLRDTYAAVWWFVRPGTVKRMTEVVRSCGATRLIEVHPWDGRT